MKKDKMQIARSQGLEPGFEKCLRKILSQKLNMQVKRRQEELDQKIKNIVTEALKRIENDVKASEQIMQLIYKPIK